MRIYLVDDRGIDGEYAAFLNTYKDRFPPFSLDVFTHWTPLLNAIQLNQPDLILADMRFDEIKREQLYGDIDALANSERFCGNTERAEAQIRGMQGLLICRALREHQIQIPIILFATLNPLVVENILKSLAPIRIIKGLILDDIMRALEDILPRTARRISQREIAAA